MKRIIDQSIVTEWDMGKRIDKVRYEPENEWERQHLELLTMGPFGPCRCAECADEILTILQECAKEHGVKFE